MKALWMEACQKPCTDETTYYVADSYLAQEVHLANRRGFGFRVTYPA